jgi:hypothetical protein
MTSRCFRRNAKSESSSAGLANLLAEAVNPVSGASRATLPGVLLLDRIFRSFRRLRAPNVGSQPAETSRR